MKFGWNANKAEANLRKHGVDFDEATTVFGDPLAGSFPDIDDDLRPEYDFDFSKAVRGKHYDEYMRITNVVILEPDVAAAFQNSEAVNAALRSMLQFAERTAELTTKANRESR